MARPMVAARTSREWCSGSPRIDQRIWFRQVLKGTELLLSRIERPQKWRRRELEIRRPDLHLPSVYRQHIELRSQRFGLFVQNAGGEIWPISTVQPLHQALESHYRLCRGKLTVPRPMYKGLTQKRVVVFAIHYLLIRRLVFHHHQPISFRVHGQHRYVDRPVEYDVLLQVRKRRFLGRDAGSVVQSLQVGVQIESRVLIKSLHLWRSLPISATAWCSRSLY